LTDLLLSKEDMPRKKITTEDELPAVPKRTRRVAASRVATAASAPAPERPRIMSSEEKRQLILAHARERQPVDAVQRFSLWTGVAVCVLAITVGWVYTMRQSIAGSISGGASAEEKVDYESLKASIHKNIGQMVDEIDVLQDEHLSELQAQAELIQAGSAVKASTSTEMATPSSSTVRGDLFQPTDDTGAPPVNDFRIPSGVSIDTLNTN